MKKGRKGLFYKKQILWFSVFNSGRASHVGFERAREEGASKAEGFQWLCMIIFSCRNCEFPTPWPRASYFVFIISFCCNSLYGLYSFVAVGSLERRTAHLPIPRLRNFRCAQPTSNRPAIIFSYVMSASPQFCTCSFLLSYYYRRAELFNQAFCGWQAWVFWCCVWTACGLALRP